MFALGQATEQETLRRLREQVILPVVPKASSGAALARGLQKRTRNRIQFQREESLSF